MSTIETMSPDVAIGRRAGSSLFLAAMEALWARVVTRRQLRRTRIHLMELSDGELADIGLTRQAAEREASRSLMACYLNNAR